MVLLIELDVLWLPQHPELVLKDGEDPEGVGEALGLRQKIYQQAEVVGAGLERDMTRSFNVCIRNVHFIESVCALCTA